MQNPISGNRVRRSLRRQGGFTLIEVMIVVVIVVILARVALPSYQSSVRKARRADAVDATTSILQVQERCRASQPTYAGSVSALATCISGSA
ncbi:MAG TPA: type IV pilin protein, partial [Burkholderiaceae bacterium]|nr:type IV pilin protein [Burkholderiaceae bacterium]